MRHIPLALSLLGAVLVTGCNNLSWTRQRDPVADVRVGPNPTSEQIVATLNENARRIQSIQCNQVDLDCTQGLQSVGLQGKMACQQGHNFRMTASVAGTTMVDLGSNDQEFWYWISKAEPPYQFHCAYQDFATGNVRMPFPFQPEWVMEALGMAQYDTTKPYQVVVRGNTIELVEQARGPDGRPVRKVTVLTRTNAQQVQVTAHLLKDANDRLICAANIKELQYDRATGAIVPKRVQLDWPAERITMKMKLDSVTVNGQIPPEVTVRLFNRPQLPNIQGYDLARGPDSNGGPIRQASGTYR